MSLKESMRENDVQKDQLHRVYDSVTVIKGQFAMKQRTGGIAFAYIFYMGIPSSRFKLAIVPVALRCLSSMKEIAFGLHDPDKIGIK